MASIRTNFLYSSALTAANYVFPLLVFPYVSRVLGVTNMGLCNFIDGVITYFVLVSMMGISVAGIREVAAAKSNQARLREAFNSLLVLNGLTTLAVLLVLVGATIFVPQLREHSDMMALGALKLIFNCFLLEWLFKGLEDFRYITIRSIVLKTLYVVAVFVLVRDTNDYAMYYGLSVALVVANGAVNVVYARKLLSWRAWRGRLKRYTRGFMTLGFYILLTSMYTTFNVAYLGFAAGDTEVGYYTTATKLFQIVLALFTAFTGVMMPRMSVLVAEGRIAEMRHAVARSYDGLNAFAVPLVVFLLIMADPVVRIVAGPGYGGAVVPLQLVAMLVLVIGYEQVLVIQTLMPLGRDGDILRNSAIGAVAGLTLNIVLVGVFHLAAVGSSIVWAACEVLTLVLSAWCVRRALGMGLELRRLARCMLLYAPLALGLWAVMVVCDTAWSRILAGGALAAVYSLAVNGMFYRDGIVWQYVLKIGKIKNKV